MDVINFKTKKKFLLTKTFFFNQFSEVFVNYIVQLYVAAILSNLFLYRNGRKKTSLVAFVGHFITAIILSLSPCYEFYIIFLILLGINSVVVYNSVFVWSKFTWQSIFL